MMAATGRGERAAADRIGRACSTRLCVAAAVLIAAAGCTGSGSALLSSVVFFLVTNFAHWLFMEMYPQTLAGLLTGYAAALPFFKYQLAGDLFWSAMLFGGYALSCRCLPLLQLQATRPVRT